MGQVGERPQWLFAAMPSTRSVAEPFHIGSDWGAVDGQAFGYHSVTAGWPTIQELSQ